MKCLCLFELQLYPRVVHVNLIDVSYSCKFIFMLFEQAELRNYGWLVIMVFIIYLKDLVAYMRDKKICMSFL